MILAMERHEKDVKFFIVGHDLGALVSIEIGTLFHRSHAIAEPPANMLPGRYLGRGFQGMVYGGLQWMPSSLATLEQVPNFFIDQLSRAFPKVDVPVLDL
jgi:hypothetical protein